MGSILSGDRGSHESAGETSLKESVQREEMSKQERKRTEQSRSQQGQRQRTEEHRSRGTKEMPQRRLSRNNHPDRRRMRQFYYRSQGRVLRKREWSTISKIAGRSS